MGRMGKSYITRRAQTDLQTGQESEKQNIIFRTRFDLLQVLEFSVPFKRSRDVGCRSIFGFCQNLL